MTDKHISELTAKARAMLKSEASPDDLDTQLRRARMQLDGKKNAEGSNVPAVLTPPAIPGPRNLETLNLGTMAADQEAVVGLVNKRRAWVLDEAGRAPDRNSFLVQHYPLDLEEYCVFAGKHGQLVREYQSERGLISYSANPGLIGLLLMPWSPDFTADYRGWISYLLTVAPQFEKEIRGLVGPSALTEDARKLNTLIVAPIGWGKSELMKALAYHYTQDKQAALVVLDPGGDMARQIARWPELVNDNRAILVEPNLQRGMTVGFNPLDGSGINDEETRTLVAGDWAQVLGDLTQDLSAPMLNMAQNCMHVLLAFPGSATFTDLKLLLTRREKRKNEYAPPRSHRHAQLLDFAENYPLPRVRDYFKHDFLSESANSTRSALSNRIGTLLSLPYVEAMFCGPPSGFDLPKAIEDRKFVLFNLARFGRQGSITVGKLLVAYLGAIGRRREYLPASQRVPTHIFIDEATTLASTAMLENLNQLRKWGVHQTLAQQVGGDGFDAAAKKVLKTNTRCKFYAGPVSEMASVLDMGEKTDDLPKIGAGQFWVQWPDRNGLGRLAVADGLVNDKHSVTDARWHEVEAQLIKDYYRSTDFTRPEMVFEDTPEMLAPVQRRPASDFEDFVPPTFVASSRPKLVEEPELELPAAPAPPQNATPAEKALPKPPKRAASPAAKGQRPKREG